MLDRLAGIHVLGTPFNKAVNGTRDLVQIQANAIF